MDVRLLCVLCVVRKWSVRGADHLNRGVVWMSVVNFVCCQVRSMRRAAVSVVCSQVEVSASG